jgi:hypothetical protein
MWLFRKRRAGTSDKTSNVPETGVPVTAKDVAISRELFRRLVKSAEDDGSALMLYVVCETTINTHRDQVHIPEVKEFVEEVCALYIAYAAQLRKMFLEGPASHAGYETLVALRAEEQDYDEAIRLAEEAKAQNWDGNWDDYIAKCRAALNRQR